MVAASGPPKTSQPHASEEHELHGLLKREHLERSGEPLSVDERHFHQVASRPDGRVQWCLF